MVEKQSSLDIGPVLGSKPTLLYTLNYLFYLKKCRGVGMYGVRNMKREQRNYNNLRDRGWCVVCVRNFLEKPYTLHQGGCSLVIT